MSEWKLQGWVGGVARGRKDTMVPESFITDMVDPCCYVFIRLAPRGHGAVVITR